MHYLYINAAPLEYCEFPGLNRRIGIGISDKFHHRGAGREMVDMWYERISLNTQTFGKPYPPDEAAAKAREMTERVIEDLDKAILELMTHRARLAASLVTMEADVMAALAPQTEAA